MRTSCTIMLTALLAASCVHAVDISGSPAQADSKPRLAQAIPDVEPEVTQQVRTILLQQADGSIGPEPFTGKMQAQLFPDQAKQMGAQLRSNGALDALQLLERKVDGENRLYRYRAIYRNKTLLLDVTYGKSGKIDLWQWMPE